MAEPPHLPTKPEIMGEAIKLFQEEAVKKGLPAIVPTERELKEGNYFEKARVELMTGIKSQLEEYLAYLVTEAESIRDQLGIRPAPPPKEVRELLEQIDVVSIRLSETRRKLREAKAEIERLRVVKVPPTVVERPPFPPPPAVLSTEERNRLEDEFKAALMRELGRIPRDVMAEFRLELEKVKTKPYAEALDQILGLAREIAWRIVRMPKPPRVPVVEVAVPPELAVPLPIPLPKMPISPLPFPRAPSTEEKAVLLDHFRSRLAEFGIDHYRFMPAFKERILNWIFRNWTEVLKLFDELISDIVAGKKLKLIPIPPMPWKEEKKREDAIVHFTATKLYKTMDELIDAVGQWGVHRVTPEEAKAAIKKAWKEKSVWFTSVSKELLESLIGEPVSETT